MKYVLDTNVVSSLITGKRNVIGRLAEVEPDDVAVPAPVFAEIAYGIARLTASKRRDSLRQSFELLRSELPVALWSHDVSEAFGRIKAELERRGTRIEDFDAAIAAHALAHGAALVTANKKHMARVPGLSISDWSAD